MKNLYRKLGGIQESPVLRPGPWDLCFGDLLVELDEELHFNRYRAETLSTSSSGELPWAKQYLDYCEDFEDACLLAGSWGKRWSNASCARMFTGGPPRDLEAGAPRWKQRALYDFMKDAATASIPSLCLSRVSVHDTIDGERLGDFLEGFVMIDPTALLSHVRSRSNATQS